MMLSFQLNWAGGTSYSLSRARMLAACRTIVSSHITTPETIAIV
ncbi:MAG TPA: hypothetical protein VIG72_02515 [Pontibacter sp.]